MTAAASLAVPLPWAPSRRPARAARVPRPAAMPDALPHDEAALLGRIAAGDRLAFQAFYELYAGKVLAYVRMLSRDSGAAEDVVQEVFLAVFRKAASYRPERGDVAGWLYTITRNKLVDLWRRREPGSEVDPDFDLARLAEEQRGPSSEMKLSLRQVLAELSEDQRRAVELAYFGGLTYEETAERLNLPLGTLKSRIRAGLMKMRARLSNGLRAEVENA